MKSLRSFRRVGSRQRIGNPARFPLFARFSLVGLLAIVAGASPFRYTVIAQQSVLPEPSRSGESKAQVTEPKSQSPSVAIQKPAIEDINPVETAIDAAVSIAGEPVAAHYQIEIEKPDPALSTLISNLEALAAGKLSETVEISSLFTLPVERFNMVRRRLGSLPQEIDEIETEIASLDKRLAHPEVEVPPVQTPELLLAPLERPVAPTLPEAPKPPPGRKLKGKWAQKKDPERFAAWEAYENQQAQYEQAVERYHVLEADYRREIAEFETASQQRAAVREVFERAKEQRVERLEKWRRALLMKRDTQEMKLRIAHLRFRYLKALDVLSQPLTQPARNALLSLNSPRYPLHTRADMIDELSRAFERLRSRVQTLLERAEVDAFAGLRVERKAVRSSLSALMISLSDLAERFHDDADELRRLAARLEKEGAALRRSILVSVLLPDRQRRLDKSFLQHLRESRYLTRSGAYEPESELEPNELARRIDRLLSDPVKIVSASQAKNAIEQIYFAVEDAESIQRDAASERLHYRGGFERESLALLTGLASAATRKRAYSISEQFLSYLLADLQIVRTRLKGYMKDKVAQSTGLADFAMTFEGVVLFSKLVAAVVLMIFVLRSRRRVRGLVNRTVRLLRGFSFFRRRIGLLVRWAGFAQAILPTVVLVFAGYAAFFLIGFRHVEMRFIEVGFRWFMLFALGRQALLGLTRQVSRGQPALLPMAPAHVDLLRVTYIRLGLGLAITASADEWSQKWLGAGSLSVLVRWVVWIWVAIWVVWAALIWRRVLGETLSAMGEENGIWRRIGRTMTRYRVLAIFSPLAFVVVLIAASVRLLKSVLEAGGFFKYLRARSLLRMSKRATESEAHAPAALPERYTKQFPLYPILGESEAEVVVRQGEFDRVLDQLKRWQTTRQEGSLVIIGDKGMGKTTMAAILTRQINAMPVAFYTFTKKVRSEKDLVKELASPLGVEDATNIGMLASYLNKGEDRVLLLDEAHNLFIRAVDGYDAYEALVRLVNYTSKNVFWVLVFNRFAWEFLNQSRRRVHYFRKLMHLSPWTADELKELIARRNARAGLAVEFDEFLLDREASLSDELELVENVDAYFRLLKESSGGNPRVATYLWLNSLRPLTEEKLRLGLFRQESSKHLEQLDSELLFALAAICQHENLSVTELRELLNVPLDFAGFAMRYLSEYGYIEPKHTDNNRFALAPRFYPQVLKVLRTRHLLFE